MNIIKNQNQTINQNQSKNFLQNLLNENQFQKVANIITKKIIKSYYITGKVNGKIYFDACNEKAKNPLVQDMRQNAILAILEYYTSTSKKDLTQAIKQAFSGANKALSQSRATRYSTVQEIPFTQLSDDEMQATKLLLSYNLVDNEYEKQTRAKDIEKIRQILDLLTDRQKDVIKAKWNGCVSVRQIADKLRLKKSTIQDRMTAIRQILKENNIKYND